MDSIEHSSHADSTIDFVPGAPSPHGLGFSNRLRLGSVSLAQCYVLPNDGIHIAGSQVAVGIYDGANFHMDWRLPESDCTHSGTMHRGQAHLGDGRIPLWVRSTASPSFFAFAMDESFFAEVSRSAFDGASDYALQTMIGVEDPVIRAISRLAQRELRQGGVGGRLLAEGMASALAVHVLRTYGAASTNRIRVHKGGLAMGQLRRVMEYIDANISDELSLTDLAKIAGLSSHHFGHAFKATTGRSPHRYVIEKRIHRARHLLLDEKTSIAEIALDAGFSNQSHLTINFRRLTGITPAQFRRCRN